MKLCARGGGAAARMHMSRAARSGGERRAVGKS
jgi:hypothetical protein